MINPILFRLNPRREDLASRYASVWFTSNKKLRKQYMIDDQIIFFLVNKFYENCPLSEVQIVRRQGRCTVYIASLFVGKLVGVKAATINELKEMLNRCSTTKRVEVQVKTLPNYFTARFVAESIALAMNTQSNWIRDVRTLIRQLEASGIKGYRIRLAGRINRSEKTKERKLADGTLPLQTVNAEIDYHLHDFISKLGSMSVKVWLHKK